VSTTDSFAVLDLSTENYGRCTTFDSNDKSLFVVDDMIETLSPVPLACGWEYEQEKDLQVHIRVIFGAVGFTLLAILLAVTLYRRSKQKRQRGLVTVAAVLGEVALDRTEKQELPEQQEQSEELPELPLLSPHQRYRRNNEHRAIFLPKKINVFSDVQFRINGERNRHIYIGRGNSAKLHDWHYLASYSIVCMGPYDDTTSRTGLPDGSHALQPFWLFPPFSSQINGESC